MAYKFKYNERPRSYSEEKHGDEDIPSAKAVRDTAVEERDGKIIKSRRQHVCGREYIVFAEFSFGGTQSTVDLMKQVIDLEQDAKNISAKCALRDELTGESVAAGRWPYQWLASGAGLSHVAPSRLGNE